MPALLPVANVIKFNVFGATQDSPWENIFHARYSGTGLTDADLLLLAQDFLAVYEADFLPFMSGQAHTTGVHAIDLTSNTSPVADYAHSSSGGAAGTGSDLSAQTAVCLSWGIDRRYRGGHPRTYLSGMRSTFLASNSNRDWSATFIGAVQSGAAAFIPAVNSLVDTHSHTLTLCTVHYASAHAVLNPPTVDNILRVAIHPRVCTQRRRLGKEIH